MDIYGSDALGSRSSARGPQRQAADPYGAYALVPAPKPAAQAANPAAKQVAAQNAAAERMAAQLAEMQAQLKAMKPAPAPSLAARPAGQTSGPGTGPLMGQTPSSSPAQAPGVGQVPQGTPAAVSKGNPIAGPRRGFALSPEDAWLARLGFHADNWLDLHPTARAVYLQRAGCDLNAMNSVVAGLNAHCSRRTGRPTGPTGPTGPVRGQSPTLAQGPTAVTVQASKWPDRYGYQPIYGDANSR